MIIPSDRKAIMPHSFKMDFYSDNLPIGELELSPFAGRIIGVWNVLIYGDYRGIGMGNQMIQELVDMIKMDFWDFQKLFLYVAKDNDKAIKAYIRAGFRFVTESELNQYADIGYKLMEMEIK